MRLRPRSMVAAVALLASVVSLSQANAQLGTGDTAVGYIDTSMIADQARFRFDAGYGIDVPTRAEFFYAKSGRFRSLPPSDPLFDPEAAGPPKAESNVDYQDFSLYVEKTINNWCSGFVELPVRLLNPEVNDNASGLGDMNAGFKLGLLNECGRRVTFQLRTYAPTGDAGRGLGTHHVSLEPALLVFRPLTDHLNFEGEVRDWIAVGGSDFAGNVLRYGAALSYKIDIPCSCGCVHPGGPSVTPVVEAVGWTVLNGLKSDPTIPPNPVADAAGDTIVNLKFGVRFGFNSQSQLYAGYGHAVTADVWYEDMLRVEYRLFY